MAIGGNGPVGQSATSLQRRVRAELYALRERRGISVDRVASTAPSILSHQATDHELQFRGWAEADRPSAALSVVECHARSDMWHPHTRLILLKTLNFEAAPGGLDDRRGYLSNVLGIGPSRYRSDEDRAYEQLAYQIATASTSPCTQDPGRSMHDVLAQLSLDHAITLAGNGDEAEGMRRVRQFLDARIPLTMATFAGRSENLFDAPIDPDATLRRRLHAMLRIIRVLAYPRMVQALKDEADTPWGVLPPRLLPLLIDEESSGKHWRDQLALSLRDERVGLDRQTSEAPPTLGEVVNNTVRVVVRVIEVAEELGNWREIIDEARKALEDAARHYDQLEHDPQPFSIDPLSLSGGDFDYLTGGMKKPDSR